MDRLERVNYYPGQRLLADDLNDQEAYEIRLRHLLNSGLFSSGVVSGLEVTKKSTKEITIGDGLALDHLGRELFLASASDQPVPNQPPLTGLGYYIVIRYRETAVPGRPADCLPSGALPASRFRLEPILEFTEAYPDPQNPKNKCEDGLGDFNCGVVLALIRLNDSCEIASVETGFRQFAYPTHMSRVTAMALEGEKDIDPSNPKILKFHVRGGIPNSVILYIRGARFSTLYYTQLARHGHSLSLSQVPTSNETAAIDLRHTHGVNNMDTGAPTGSPVHHHSVRLSNVMMSGINTLNQIIGSSYMAEVNNHGSHYVSDEETAHTHGVTGNGTGDSTMSTAPVHHHTFDKTTATGDRGATTSDLNLPTDQVLGYVNDLRVSLDGLDITPQLLAHVPEWTTLGKGNDKDPVNTVGTPGIDLMRLPGVTIIDGPHEIVFSVASGGGKVLYNLYVE